jgi:uncharacterized protein (DUF488 family)
MPAIQRPLKLPSRPVRVQADGKELWNEAREIATADFFTIGYAGRTVQDLIDLLNKAGVQSLIDIRFSPISMYRPELSKANLQRSIETAGLQYLHVPRLGVPRQIRAKAINVGSRDVIWKWYEKSVVQPFLQNNLDEFLNFAEHPVAFMCVELDPRECHRHLLFQALEDHGLQGFDL